VLCPHCLHAIEILDVNLRPATATCVACGQAFSYADGLQRVMAKPTFEQPETVSLQREKDDLVITMRRSKAIRVNEMGVLTMLLLAIFACYILSMLVEAHAKSGTILIMLATVALCLYFMVAKLVNHFTIRVNRKTMAVYARPLPDFRHFTLDVRQLQRLYVQSERANVEHIAIGTQVVDTAKGITILRCTSAEIEAVDTARGLTSYHLVAKLLTGKRKILLPAFQKGDVAILRFVQQEIERHLGIADIQVVGDAVQGK
jgi:hypothetical protein